MPACILFASGGVVVSGLGSSLPGKGVEPAVEFVGFLTVRGLTIETIGLPGWKATVFFCAAATVAGASLLSGGGPGGGGGLVGGALLERERPGE